MVHDMLCLAVRKVSDRKTRASFTKYLGLSGITDLVMPRHLELMRNSSETEEVELETTLLGDLLDELQAPKFIDYLSLDTEVSMPSPAHIKQGSIMLDLRVRKVSWRQPCRVTSLTSYRLQDLSPTSPWILR